AFALRDNPQGARRHPTATASSSASHSKDAEVEINQKLAALAVDEKKISSAAELSITAVDPSSASKEKTRLSTTVDEFLFPPRCCGVPISLDLIRSFLSAKLLGTYLAKKLEYETIDKTYCHVSTCSTFVPPVFLRDGVATCIKCQSKTCAMCKDRMHTQGDCPADTLTAEVLRMAD
ncbi:hypothetical protein E4U52_008182, partial [Claviceps spartinae]